MTAATTEFVIVSYRRPRRIEKSLRMSKSDLAARPIKPRLRDSFDAYPSIVFTALAITRVIESRSDWSIKKLVTNHHLPPPG